MDKLPENIYLATLVRELEPSDKKKFIAYLRERAEECMGGHNNYSAILADILKNNVTFFELEADGIEDMFPVLCDELNNDSADKPVLDVIKGYMYDDAKGSGLWLTRSIATHFARYFFPLYLPGFLDEKYGVEKV